MHLKNHSFDVGQFLAFSCTVVKGLCLFSCLSNPNMRPDENKYMSVLDDTFRKRCGATTTFNNKDVVFFSRLFQKPKT